MVFQAAINAQKDKYQYQEITDPICTSYALPDSSHPVLLTIFVKSSHSTA